MDATVKPLPWFPARLRELVLDVTVPLVFAILTAGFFVLAAQ